MNEDLARKLVALASLVDQVATEFVLIDTRKSIELSNVAANLRAWTLPAMNQEIK